MPYQLRSWQMYDHLTWKKSKNVSYTAIWLSNKAEKDVIAQTNVETMYVSSYWLCETRFATAVNLLRNLLWVECLTIQATLWANWHNLDNSYEKFLHSELGILRDLGWCSACGTSCHYSAIPKCGCLSSVQVTWCQLHYTVLPFLYDTLSQDRPLRWLRWQKSRDTFIDTICQPYSWQGYHTKSWTNQYENWNTLLCFYWLSWPK